MIYSWVENCTKFAQLLLSKIIDIVATSCQILRLKCTKFDRMGRRPRPRWGAQRSALSQTIYLDLRGLVLRGRDRETEEGKWMREKGKGKRDRKGERAGGGEEERGREWR